MPTTDTPDPFETTLDDGERACSACGVATTSDVTEIFDSWGYITIDAGVPRQIDRGASYMFAVCDACVARRESARALLSEHPAVARYIGTRSIGDHRVALALDAAAAIGAEPPKSLTDNALYALIDALAPLGGSARWSGRFAPIRLRGTSTDRCAPEPWLHVPVVTRQSIRSAYTDWLASTLPPVTVQCPSGGCLLCGVSSVMARRSETPWHPFSTGALSRGKNLAGNLCAACWSAYEAEGTIGPALLSRALLEAIDADGHIRARLVDTELEGITAWAVTGDPPAAAPWAHMDVAALLSLLPTRGRIPARIALTHEPTAAEW